MTLSPSLDIVWAHAEGEVGLVIVGGAPEIPGRTVADKLAHLAPGDHPLFGLALFEPRGKAQMSANLVLPPSVAGADAGFVILQPDGAHAMSGSNAMCVVTVLLETGMVPITGPRTPVVLDTAAGLVRAVASCAGGRCERVTLEFVPSFAAALDRPLEVEGLGTLSVDIAFSGCWFVLVDAAPLGFEIVPAEARELVSLGGRIRDAARRQIEIRHPVLDGFEGVEYALFHRRRGDTARTGNVMYPGRLDRSPCGTGSAALLAALHARGEMGIGESLETRSIVDSAFTARIARAARVGPHAAIVPEISGRAWIFGRGTLGADPSDPFAAGFTLADVWGDGVGRGAGAAVPE